MTFRTSTIGGEHNRVADPRWVDPLDPEPAAVVRQRWNPSGVPCLYLNADLATARANVVRRFVGEAFGPEDLDPDLGPVLVMTEVPPGTALDAYTGEGIAAAGLPDSYPLLPDGTVVPHSSCQPIGRAALDAGLDGVDARSAAPGGNRELGWFPRDRRLRVSRRIRFGNWFPV